jgi:putative transcription factor
MSQPQKELIEVVVDDYAKRIREAREKARLTQKDFAKALNERESIIKKLESGGFMPPLSLARKLEKTLKIVLVEVQEETTSAAGKGKHDGPLTIGDIAKLNL